jgi:hypothetical protein
MSEHTTTPVDRRVKVPHLVFGLLFLGVAAIWVLGETDAISGERLAILGPGVLILAGVVGLATSLASGRNRRRAAAAYEPVESPVENTDTYPDTDHDVTDQTDGDEHTQEIR